MKLGFTVPFILMLASGCEDKAAPPAPVKAAPTVAPVAQAAPVATAAAVDPAEAAEDVWAQRCTSCHGASGKGDGAAAVALTPKPRDFSDVAWQTSVTDEQISKAIVEGGASIGKSPLMTPNPDLKAKPDVVAALVKSIRALKK